MKPNAKPRTPKTKGLHPRNAHPECVFKHIVGGDELFDLTLCNSPFHGSLAEATTWSERKMKNLATHAAKKGSRSRTPATATLNFGGQCAELWCPGGEVGFIKCMVEESAGVASQCLWFSTLVSKNDNLPAIYTALDAAAAIEVKTITMQQGQKVSRIVAWTFLSREQQIDWCRARWSE